MPVAVDLDPVPSPPILPPEPPPDSPPDSHSESPPESLNLKNLTGDSSFYNNANYLGGVVCNNVSGRSLMLSIL